MYVFTIESEGTYLYIATCTSALNFQFDFEGKHRPPIGTEFPAALEPLGRLSRPMISFKLKIES
jgi:hypothetical protein